MLNIIIRFLFLSFVFMQTTANGVAVVVDKHIITYADVFQQLSMMQEQGLIPFGEEEKTEALVVKSLVDRLVLLSFAEKDTLFFVDDDEVESQLDLQINSFVERVGSVSALEEYFGKNINNIRRDYWKDVYENILIEKYKYSLVSAVEVQKKEVEIFYEKYKDSIPAVPANVNVDIINMKFAAGYKTINSKKLWLASVKDSILSGSFSLSEAVERHSNIPNNGVVGYTERGTLFKEYEIAAYSSSVGDLVGPIKTSAGLHLIKILDRKGDKINTQHLLVAVEPSQQDKKEMVETINDYYTELQEDPLFLENVLFSDDFGPLFGYSGVHENIYLSSFPSDLSDAIKNTPEGGVFGPLVLSDETLVLGKVHEFFKESKPTLENSYDFISLLAKEEKQNSILNDWLSASKEKIFIDNKINK